MAIQMRRGLLANYDEDKMVAGELAVTTDATTEDQQVFVAFAPGDSKRVLTDTDLSSLNSTIGSLSDLDTTDKSNLVAAINEAAQSGGSESGLTAEIKAALLQLAQKVAYIDANGQTYYDDLYDALYPPNSSITYTLSHVTSSNNTVTVENGTRYTTTLTASTNYIINTVSVTMGGVDITSSVYTSGTITIPSVTGNIVITATAVLVAQSITATYTQSGTVYDTDTLDSLKSDLVVVATYADSSTATIPSADYTLSGTLTVGTSTITVSYGGKTTTFTVTVTDSRQLPTQYTWLYDPQSGDLLSEESYVTMGTGGSGGTETIVDGVLVLSCDSPPTSTTSTNFLRYFFADSTTSNAKISTRSKIIKAPTTLVSTGLGGYRLQLSNGTNGAQAYFYNSDGYIMVGYYEGGTRKTVTTEFLVGDWHVFEMEMSGTTQKLSIDGTEIFNVTSLSTYYCTANAMLNQAPNQNQANGVETQIDWFAYYEA